ncbi:hypothetical protein [Actibacterium sp. 188UL27-1]|uniref:hypothetical protein n=1 Tax=Actibacterium sp. 188UL27-1 TaxID=2786961 RepID=UPI001958676A|nr:hypothetical protein [Actibacterium sp. 188UL27-1]MBM7066892.1 hypothetical protein [Actibacterium sp. 188UL27-1]
MACVSVIAYAGYIWPVGRAGSVFAVQVSYFVTIFGIGWSMLLLGERFASGFWLALVLMLGGLFLVQPRRVANALVPPGRTRHDAG